MEIESTKHSNSISNLENGNLLWMVVSPNLHTELVIQQLFIRIKSLEYIICMYLVVKIMKIIN